MADLLAGLIRGVFITDQESQRPAESTGSSPTAGTPCPRGVVIGRIDGVTESGQPLIALPSTLGGHRLPARSLVPIEAGQIGSEAALVFPEGDANQALVLGILQGPVLPAASRSEQAPQMVSVRADGHRVLLTADREIVLRCGKASITLTADGNVLIRGTYVLSRASGTNRIRGGNVQIN